jgi:hypothetical protein
MLALDLELNIVARVLAADRAAQNLAVVGVYRQRRVDDRSVTHATRELDTGNEFLGRRLIDGAGRFVVGLTAIQ